MWLWSLLIIFIILLFLWFVLHRNRPIDQDNLTNLTSQIRYAKKKGKRKNIRLDLDQLEKDLINKYGIAGHDSLNSVNRINPKIDKSKGLNKQISVSSSQSYQSTQKEKSTKKIVDDARMNQSTGIEKSTSSSRAVKIESVFSDDYSLSESVSTHVKKKILRVDYDSKKMKQIQEYPLLLAPEFGCVVRSHKLGNIHRRGFKEESFELSLRRTFSKYVEVHGNLRINTGNGTRPFEPDIAIVDVKYSNLRIDVEIDEPYAGITRQPAHCKGEDDARDKYFVDRGWMVVRFTEFQVHTQEEACLKLIADILSVVIPEFEMPYELRSVKKLIKEDKWSVLRAQKWESENYREGYLNHTFREYYQPQPTLDLKLDQQELNEEKQVESTTIIQGEPIDFRGFNAVNRMGRDKRVSFDSENHQYYIDGVPARTVSNLVEKSFPVFDSIKAAQNLSPNHPLFGLDVLDIVKLWEENRLKAARLGSELHNQIEKYLLTSEQAHSREFELFQSFYLDHPEITPFRSEWRIFDEKFGIAGTVDLLAVRNGEFVLFDWKRSDKIIDPYTGQMANSPFLNFGIGPLSHLSDSRLNKYALQQSLYRWILEKNYGLTISEMNLVILHPSYNRYFKITVPYLFDEVNSILVNI